MTHTSVNTAIYICGGDGVGLKSNTHPYKAHKPGRGPCSGVGGWAWTKRVDSKRHYRNVCVVERKGGRENREDHLSSRGGTLG